MIIILYEFSRIIHSIHDIYGTPGSEFLTGFPEDWRCDGSFHLRVLSGAHKIQRKMIGIEIDSFVSAENNIGSDKKSNRRADRIFALITSARGREHLCPIIADHVACSLIVLSPPMTIDSV